jgi:hypothetical protein
MVARYWLTDMDAYKQRARQADSQTDWQHPLHI